MLTGLLHCSLSWGEEVVETGDYIGFEVKTTTEAGWRNGQSRQLLEGGL